MFEHSEKHAGGSPRNLFLFLHAHGMLYSSIILVSVAYRLIIKGNGGQSPMLLLGSSGIFATLLTTWSTLKKTCSCSAVRISGKNGLPLIVW
jgi:hypothetical protein